MITIKVEGRKIYATPKVKIKKNHLSQSVHGQELYLTVVLQLCAGGTPGDVRGL